MIKVAGGKIVEIRGTYVHPDLIPHIASWATLDIRGDSESQHIIAVQ